MGKITQELVTQQHDVFKAEMKELHGMFVKGELCQVYTLKSAHKSWGVLLRIGNRSIGKLPQVIT